MLEQVVLKSQRTTETGQNGSDPRQYDNIFYPNDSANQFYVAMLSISLIIGIIYACYVIYNYWYKGRVLLGFVVALVISSLLRTFFSLLLWTVFVLGESTDWPGSNTLLTFECYFLMMVFSYSLVLTVYFHECVDNSFNSEPNIKLFHYGIPGIATFFTLVWTFILAGENYNWLHILIIPGYQWIMRILMLLYLCVQLGLILNMGVMIVARKSTYDSVCLSLLRKAGLALFGLVALLWLHFGFLVGKPPWNNAEVYLYFLYLVDGLQCALLCPLLYFMEKWGQEILNKCPCESTAFGRRNPPPVKPQEILIKNPNRRTDISTIESVIRNRVESTPDAEAQDVVYTNVVSPERLQKTLDLYKRLGIISANDITVISGENYYECREDDAKTVYNDCTSKESDKAESDGGERENRMIVKGSKPCRNKNAFYASKYLIINRTHDGNSSKDSQDRKSVDSQSNCDKKNNRHQHQNSEEMVAKWLENNSKSDDSALDS